MYVQSYNLCNSGKIKLTKELFTRGGKIFLAFLLIEYLLPLFLNLIFDFQPIFRMPIYSPGIVYAILLLVTVSIIAVIVAKYTPSITPINIGPIRPLPKWFILFASIIAIVIGYLVFTSGLTQWRYTSTVSSDRLILYASVIQYFLPVISFWVLMTDHQFIKSRTSFDMLVKGMLMLGLIFSMNGLGSMFVSFVFALVFIMPKTVLGLLFSNVKQLEKNRSFFRKISILIFIPVIIFPILIVGAFSKSGNRFNVNEIISAHIGFDYLVNRHSIHLSSLAASIEDGPNFSDMSIPVNTTIYRLKLITGIDANAEKPEISSFSRLALLQFADYENIKPRGGSSPGLLASLTMVLPLPLAAISIFFATFVLIKLIDFILCRQPPFSWTGAILFAYIPFRFATDSPFDMFVPGPVLIVLLLPILLSLRREKL